MCLMDDFWMNLDTVSVLVSGPSGESFVYKVSEFVHRHAHNFLFICNVGVIIKQGSIKQSKSLHSRAQIESDPVKTKKLLSGKVLRIV